MIIMPYYFIILFARKINCSKFINGRKHQLHNEINIYINEIVLRLIII